MESGEFQSTHLLRGATCHFVAFAAWDAFQSTHLLRGATLSFCCVRCVGRISIHAPLARCDLEGAALEDVYINFNPRTSCEVRRRMARVPASRGLFQSTHLLRGATLTVCRGRRSSCISIHAPLARCDITADCIASNISISIHAPLARCDKKPSSSARIQIISIHAPLARCDCTYGSRIPWKAENFNPRTSCEVRPAQAPGREPAAPFQSTHLLRGATPHGPRPGQSRPISIHAPLARCDGRSLKCVTPQHHFNPRTSCEVRPSYQLDKQDAEKFQSTHLLRGAT